MSLGPVESLRTDLRMWNANTVCSLSINDSMSRNPCQPHQSSSGQVGATGRVDLDLDCPTPNTAIENTGFITVRSTSMWRPGTLKQSKSGVDEPASTRTIYVLTLSRRHVATLGISCGATRGRQLPHLDNEDRPNNSIYRCPSILTALAVKRMTNFAFCDYSPAKDVTCVRIQCSYFPVPSMLGNRNHTLGNQAPLIRTGHSLYESTSNSDRRFVYTNYTSGGITSQHCNASTTMQ